MFWHFLHPQKQAAFAGGNDKQVSSASVVGQQTDRGDILIIDLRVGCPPPLGAFFDDLARVGVRPAAGGQEYGVLAARSNARWWLFPLDHGGACARSGLEMFQPVTQGAKILKRAVQLRARFAPSTFPQAQRMRLVGRPNFLDMFARTGLCCAYFTGTDGPHRKTAVQVMTASGNILGYAKVSRNPQVRRYIANEARILRDLAGIGLRSAAVPVVIDQRDEDDIAWLVTDSLRLPGHVISSRLGPPHRAFLSELAERRSGSNGAATLAELTETFGKLRPHISRVWTDRFDDGISRLSSFADALPVAMAHGDFTPWNSFIVGERLYVFDWEYAHPAYPLGYDQVHFALSASTDVPIDSFAERLVADVAFAWFQDNRTLSIRAILFSLLLHAAFYLRRAIKAGRKEQDWDEAERRAGLIDAFRSRLEG